MSQETKKTPPLLKGLRIIAGLMLLAILGFFLLDGMLDARQVAKYKDIKVGMSLNEVKNILGDPEFIMTTDTWVQKRGAGYEQITADFEFKGKPGEKEISYATMHDRLRLRISKDDIVTSASQSHLDW